ncbi:AMP-binding protein [Streptomyces sp. NPDC001709]
MPTGNRSLAVLHGPSAAHPDGERIDVVVARRAAERPDAPALRTRDRVVGYGELLAAARAVAAGLRARGVRSGDVVAVCAPRTPETVAGLLGILLADAAYVCVPEDWPELRRAALLRRTGAVLLLHADSGSDGEPEAEEAAHPVPTARIADLLVPSRPAPGAAGADGPQAGSGTFAGACVFLTSGTTGEPKAVLAPHLGVLRTALDPTHVLPGRMVCLQSASPAWDVFALELWVPLLRGGTCVLHDGGPLTAATLRAHLRDGVNALVISAAPLNALVEDDLGALTGLRLLYTGGSRASARHLERCRTAHPALRVVNCYGPVENTISSTSWIADGAVPDEVPIGTPSVNTSVYLLDDDHRVVPQGVPGQIAVAGDGLSMGYLGDPAETERRFPVLPLPGGPRRVYLTGDIARMDDDGRLIFLGRRDRQIKVRGMRIEAEEIERLIEAVPGVGQAHALALPLTSPVNTHLAAFYTGESAAVPADVVRCALAEQLPASFLPDLLFPLDELPLTTNAKVDQRALAELAARLAGPGEPSPGQDEEPGARGPDVLRLVLDSLVALLDRPVAPDEDIFHRGATSLTALRLATRVGARLGRDVDASAALTARTPRAIAALLAAAPALPPAPDQTADRKGTVRAPVAQGVFWAAARDGRHLDEDVVPMVYRLPHQADPALLDAALVAVVRRHEALRSRFTDGPRVPDVHVLDSDRVGPLLETQPTAASPQEAVEQARAWAHRPFDLTAGPPLRAALIPVAGRRPLLAVGVHHIVFDGWSAGLFLRDLETAHDALAAGRPPFTDTAPSYYRAADDQRERYHARFPQAAWRWASRLGDVTELRFPLGGRRPWSGPAAELPLDIPGELRERADRAAAAVGGTGLAVFHAVCVRLLRSYTGAAEPVVAVPATGRFTEQAATAIGCFAGLLPVRAPHHAVEAGDLVRAAAGQLREAMRPPLVPMEAILPELPEGCHRHPLLQAQLLQVELPPAVLSLGGGQAEYVHLAPRRTLPELTVELWLPPRHGGVLRYREDAVPAAHAADLADRLPAAVRDICAELEQTREDIGRV